MSFKVIVPKGYTPGKRKGVLFLVGGDDGFVNVSRVFDALDLNLQEDFQVSFKWWTDGHVHKKRYHGWAKSEHGGRFTNCFVFKRPRRRLYGFLYHPMPWHPDYLVVVLAHACGKSKFETDVRVLRRIEGLRREAGVAEALNIYYELLDPVDHRR